MTVFRPVLESARNNSPRSRSTCSHLRCSISRRRQPVNRSNRTAAVADAPILVKGLPQGEPSLGWAWQRGLQAE